MTKTQVGDRASNRAKAKISSKILAPFVLGGLVLPILSAAFLAIDYIEFPNTSTPTVPYIVLLFGLLLAAAGQRLTVGRWEGIGEVLHVRLAWAGLVYAGWVAKYSMAGRPIHWSPAGLLTIVSGILVISRLLVKHHAKLFATVPTER